MTVKQHCDRMHSFPAPNPAGFPEDDPAPSPSAGLQLLKSKSAGSKASMSRRTSTDGSNKGGSRPSTTEKCIRSSHSKGADGSTLISPYLQSTRLLASLSSPASKASQRQQRVSDAALDATLTNRSAAHRDSPLRPASQPGSNPMPSPARKSAPSTPATKPGLWQKRAQYARKGSFEEAGTAGRSASPLPGRHSSSSPASRPRTQPSAPSSGQLSPRASHPPQQQLQQQQLLLRTGAAGRLLQAYGQSPSISPYTQHLVTSPSAVPDLPGHPHVGPGAATGLRNPRLPPGCRSSSGSVSSRGPAAGASQGHAIRRSSPGAQEGMVQASSKPSAHVADRPSGQPAPEADTAHAGKRPSGPKPPASSSDPIAGRARANGTSSSVPGSGGGVHAADVHRTGSGGRQGAFAAPGAPHKPHTDPPSMPSIQPPQPLPPPPQQTLAPPLPQQQQQQQQQQPMPLHPAPPAGRPQAPATAAGSLRRSRRDGWPCSHQGPSGTPRVPGPDERGSECHSGASSAAGDDPLDGTVSDDYMEEAPLAGHMVDIPVVVTDGPVIVRVMSGPRVVAGARLSGGRPFSGALQATGAPQPVLGRPLSRPTSARDMHVHAWPRPASGAPSRPGSSLPRPPGAGYEQVGVGEHWGGGSRTGLPAAGGGLSVQTPSSLGYRESGGDTASHLASPSSGSGLQGLVSYDDIPDVPWEEGEESWMEAAEDFEPCDPAYRGLTLDHYMSQLVTTPASAAATSGLSGRQWQGSSASAAQDTPTEPPPPPGTSPSRASHTALPQTQALGLQGAVAALAVAAPAPAPAAATAEAPPSLPMATPRTPSARAQGVPEHGLSPWHQPAAQVGPQFLLPKPPQQQQQQQQQGGAPHKCPDLGVGQQPASGCDTDSLSSLDAQVPHWQEEDEEGNASSGEEGAQGGPCSRDAEEAAAEGGAVRWSPCERAVPAGAGGPPMKRSLCKDARTPGLGPMHTMPIVSSTAAAFLNSLDLRPATAAAASMIPTRTAHTALAAPSSPSSPPSPSCSSSSSQDADPSSPSRPLASPSHAHKLQGKRHPQHYREHSPYEGGHVKEVDLGGLSAELFSYSNSSSKAKQRGQVPLQLQLEYPAEAKALGLRIGDTAASSSSSLQSLAPQRGALALQAPSSRDSSSSPLHHLPSRDVARWGDPSQPQPHLQSLKPATHPSPPSLPLPLPSCAPGSSGPGAGEACPFASISPPSSQLGTSSARSSRAAGALPPPPQLPQPGAWPSHVASPPPSSSSLSSSSVAAVPFATAPLPSRPTHPTPPADAQNAQPHPQPHPPAPRELQPVHPPPRLAFDANPPLPPGTQPPDVRPPAAWHPHAPDLSTLPPTPPGAWAQRVTGLRSSHAAPAEGLEVPAALAAAAAAAMMRPVAPPPGGMRAVQSARPITRNGPAPDPSVWQGFIAQQLERPPSRQKPPPEALHLWSPEESRSTLMGHLPAGPMGDLLPSGYSGTRLRARPHSAMVAVGSYGRSILSGPALKSQPAGVPYGSVAGQHARPPTRDRPPTRQRPPPMALLLEHQEPSAEEDTPPARSEEGAEGCTAARGWNVHGGRRGQQAAAAVQDLSSDSSDG